MNEDGLEKFPVAAFLPPEATGIAYDYIGGDEGVMSKSKIAVMGGVREYAECMPVELWVTETGAIVIRSYNEGGNNFTEVDVADVIKWFRSGNVNEDENVKRALSLICSAKRDK